MLPKIDFCAKFYFEAFVEDSDKNINYPKILFSNIVINYLTNLSPYICLT